MLSVGKLAVSRRTAWGKLRIISRSHARAAELLLETVRHESDMPFIGEAALQVRAP